MGKFLYKYTSLIIIGFFIGFPVLLCYVANSDEQNDYNLIIYDLDELLKNIVLNNDTVQVLEWRTGRYDKNRGYVLSNGMTVDELIVYKNVIHDGQ